MRARLAATAAVLLVSLAPLAEAQTSVAPLSPTKLELAKRIIEANGGEAQSRALMSAMFRGMNQTVAQAMPQPQSRLSQTLRADIQSEMISLVPALLELSATAYARNLSEKELRDVLAWATSESGRSVSGKLPGIMQAVIASEGPLLAQMMPKMLQRAVDRACSEAQCTTEDRQIATDAVLKALRQPAPKPS